MDFEFDVEGLVTPCSVTLSTAIDENDPESMKTTQFSLVRRRILL